MDIIVLIFIIVIGATLPVYSFLPKSNRFVRILKGISMISVFFAGLLVGFLKHSSTFSITLEIFWISLKYGTIFMLAYWVLIKQMEILRRIQLKRKVIQKFNFETVFKPDDEEI